MKQYIPVEYQEKLTGKYVGDGTYEIKGKTFVIEESIYGAHRVKPSEYPPEGHTTAMGDGNVELTGGPLDGQNAILLNRYETWAEYEMMSR